MKDCSPPVSLSLLPVADDVLSTLCLLLLSEDCEELAREYSLHELKAERLTD